MLWQRITFGALMIAGLVGIVWLDHTLAQNVGSEWTPKLLINLGLYAREGLVITLLVAAAMFFGTLELARLLRSAGYQPALFVALPVNVVFVFIPWVVRNGLNPDVSSDPSTDYQYTVGWLTLATAATFAAVMVRRRTAGAIGAIASTMLAIIYLGFLGAFLTRVRMWGDSSWLVLYALFVCKVCDIGAYFTGLAIGRHKLIEWLSPKKTWEGLIGGVAASVLLAWGLSAAARAWAPPWLSSALPAPNKALAFGAWMGLVGQAGDLVESLFKRDAGSKDSGAVVPSFGGVLDIIDSPVMTAPLAYWMLVR